jgi:hypothetical protein
MTFLAVILERWFASRPANAALRQLASASREWVHTIKTAVWYYLGGWSLFSQPLKGGRHHG